MQTFAHRSNFQCGQAPTKQLPAFCGRLKLAGEVLSEARAVHVTGPLDTVSGAPPHRSVLGLVETAFLAYEDGLWAEAYASAAGRADAGDPRAAKLALLMLRHGARLYGVGFSAEPVRIARWAKTVLQATADARRTAGRPESQATTALDLEALASGRQRNPRSTSRRTASPSSITAIA